MSIDVSNSILYFYVKKTPPIRVEHRIISGYESVDYPYGSPLPLRYHYQ